MPAVKTAGIFILLSAAKGRFLGTLRGYRFQISCSISSFFSGSSAAGSALKVRTPSLRYSGMALTAATG